MKKYIVLNFIGTLIAATALQAGGPPPPPKMPGAPKGKNGPPPPPTPGINPAVYEKWPDGTQVKINGDFVTVNPPSAEFTTWVDAKPGKVIPAKTVVKIPSGQEVTQGRPEYTQWAQSGWAADFTVEAKAEPEKKPDKPKKVDPSQAGITMNILINNYRNYPSNPLADKSTTEDAWGLLQRIERSLSGFEEQIYSDTLATLKPKPAEEVLQNFADFQQWVEEQKAIVESAAKKIEEEDKKAQQQAAKQKILNEIRDIHAKDAYNRISDLKQIYVINNLLQELAQFDIKIQQQKDALKDVGLNFDDLANWSKDKKAALENRKDEIKPKSAQPKKKVSLNRVSKKSWAKFPAGTKVVTTAQKEIIFPVQDISPFVDAQEFIIDVASVATPGGYIFYIPFTEAALEMEFGKWLNTSKEPKIKQQAAPVGAPGQPSAGPPAAAVGLLSQLAQLEVALMALQKTL